MTTIDQTCISLSTGTLSPDLRVNYQFGMVLGLNEFLQEQVYFLDKDYLHERALHGYGTVSGLGVTVSTPQGSPPDVTVTVAAGIAIDQWGREVVVRSAQCARLGAWLAGQVQQDPNAVNEHIGLSGDLTVYVVASYAECPDDLVPIPGQPCSSSADTQVPSRTRDAWNIELRWTPPAMPAWDGLRQLARILDSVDVVAGLDPTLSSENDLIDAIRDIPAQELLGGFGEGLPGSPPGSPGFQLPAATAFDALDRILTVWVTDVRPQLGPDLIQPDETGDPAILLSTIVFTTEGGGAITSVGTDDTGRPYLLSTQLIQELRALTGVVTTAAPPPPPPQRTPEQLLSVSSNVNASGQLTITAWFHLDQPVKLPATLTATVQGGSSPLLPLSVTATSGFSNVWSLTPIQGGGIVDGSLITLTWATSQIDVGAAGTTLAQWISSHNVAPIELSDPSHLTAFTTVRTLPFTMDFVTVTPTVTDFHLTSIELWFHPDPNPASELITVSSVTGVTLFEESGPTVIPLNPPTRVQGEGKNVWAATLAKPFPMKLPAHLRIGFPAATTKVTSPITGGTQTNPVDVYMRANGIRFVGWDSASGTIVAFCRAVPSGEQ